MIPGMNDSGEADPSGDSGQDFRLLGSWMKSLGILTKSKAS